VGDGRRGARAVPRPLAVAAAWSWRLVVIAVAAGAVLVALGSVRIVVLPVAGALLVCTFLAPVVHWLDGWGLPRTLATMAVAIGTATAVAGLVAAFSLQVRDHLDDLEAGARGGLLEIEEWLVTGPVGVERARIREATDGAVDWLTSTDGLLGTGLLSRAGTALEVAGGLALLIVLVFFFLKDGDSMWRWVVRRLGPEAGPHADAAGRRAWGGLGGYMRGQAIVAGVDAVAIGLGAWLLGVSLALPIAVLTFAAGFFPIVGAVLAGSAAVLVALATEGPVTALALLAVVAAVQQIESNVLAPVIMARTARLHPVVVLLALGAGAALGGVVGAFLAVPVAAAAAAAGGYAWAQVGPAPAEVPEGGPGPPAPTVPAGPP